jgi:basic amino acid/polyamine antiporter, APA family
MSAASSPTVGSDRAAPSAEGLVRAIGRWTMVALMINMIVGSGIFNLPARVHALAGPAALLAYGACAVVIAAIAFCLGEVASRFTGTGGPYLYAREAFGPLPGFLVGWMMVLTRMTALAIIANVLADYVAFFWAPAADGPLHAAVMAVALLAHAVVNWIGVRPGAGVAASLTIAKLVPLVLFVVMGSFFLDARAFSGASRPDGATFTQAVLVLVFAFGGFEAGVVTAGEMKDPRRDLPFALLAGVGAATVLYVLIQTVCIGTLPELATSKRPLADAAVRFAGSLGGGVIAAGAIVSTFATIGGTMLAAPRVLFAMAEHGQMPDAFGRPHPRYRTPHLAILVVVAGGLALSLTGTFGYLLGLNVITRLIQYLAAALGVIALRRKNPSHPAPFTLRWAYAIAPLTAVACVWLIGRSSPNELRDAAIALGLGLAFWLVRGFVTGGARARSRPGSG